MKTRDISLFIDPLTHHFDQDGLFAKNDRKLNRDDTLAPYVFLREWFENHGIRVRTADRLLQGIDHSSKNVYVSMGIREHYQQLAQRPDVIMSAFFALECPVVEPSLYSDLRKIEPHFKRLFCFSDSESLQPFVSGALKCEQFCLPQPYESVHEELWNWENRRFLVMINGNKLPRSHLYELYSERLRAVEYFARTEEIDLYGFGWDGPPYQMGKTWLPGTVQRGRRALLKQWQRLFPNPLLESARKVYLGSPESKFETLAKYTFAICFENMILKGWITEKIFDCFHVGTIPIYWGAPEIEEHVPRECFIDRRQFSNYEELRKHLRSQSKKQIQQYKENARDFLSSSRFRPFTKHAFLQHFIRMVSEDTEISF